MVAWLLGVVSPGHASFRRYLTAAQPLMDENAHFSIGYQTYEVMGGVFPGQEILWTCSPSRVPLATAFVGEFDTCKAENANLAHQLGMVVRIEEDGVNMRYKFRPHPKGPHSGPPADGSKPGIAYVDSITVVLDVGPAVKYVEVEWKPFEQEQRESMLDAAVDYTVRCVLVNAERSQIEVRRMRLRILGSDRYRRFERVYDIPSRYPEAP